jgi:hypothetical protein
MGLPPKTVAMRRELVHNINQLFGASAINETAARLSPLKPRADFIDVSHALGVLRPFAGEDVRGYRRRVGIPQPIQKVMTLAYRTALIERIPLKLEIVSGSNEGIRLELNEQQISVELIRPDSQPSS